MSIYCYHGVSSSLGYFDRLDYCSVVCGEHLLALSLEASSMVSVFDVRRLGFIELCRGFNSLLVLSCGLLDIGGISALL